MSIITNTEKMESLALDGITAYLGGKSAATGHDGMFHGNKGKRRARIAKFYLNNSSDPVAIYGVLQFIFTSSSTRLSNLIAGKLITGNYSYGSNSRLLDNLKSSCIDSAVLEKRKEDSFDLTSNTMATLACFNKQKAIQKVLSEVINALNPADASKLKQFVKDLQHALNNKKGLTLDILPATELTEQNSLGY